MKKVPYDVNKKIEKKLFMYTRMYQLGSGALSGKMLLVRIVENNKIDAYLGQFRLSKC